MVEFTLVFTFVVFPLLLGVVQYGYLYWSKSTAAATAREAVRRLSVGTDPACTQAEVVRQASEPATGPVTYTRTGAPYTQNQVISVTVSFPTLDFGFLPVPNGGQVAETAQARVQSLHAGTAADPTIGC